MRAATLLLTFALGGGAARAQTAAPRAQRFYGRGVLGVGYGLYATTTRAGDIKISGLGVTWNFAVGVNIARGFSAHVDAAAMSLITPSVTTAGVDRVAPDRADSTSTLTLFGGGVTWSHPAHLLWASLSGGVAVLGVELPAAQRTSAGTTTPTYGQTQYGWGLNLLVGHDWPLVYHWRAGLALQAVFAQVPDQPFEGSTPTWTAFGGGLSLTIVDR